MRILMVALLIGLVGCETTSGPLGDLLKPAPPAVVGDWGDGTGYQPVLAPQVPFDVCDSPAYIDGYKDGFIYNWNTIIKTKRDTFRLRAQNRPGDRAAAYNRDLYESRVIGTRGYSSRESKYLPSSMLSKSGTCRTEAYYSGKRAGNDIATRERQALALQEK